MLFTRFTYIPLPNNEREYYFRFTKEEAEDCRERSALFQHYRASKWQNQDSNSGLHNFPPKAATGVDAEKVNNKKRSKESMTWIQRIDIARLV